MYLDHVAHNACIHLHTIPTKVKPFPFVFHWKFTLLMSIQNLVVFPLTQLFLVIVKFNPWTLLHSCKVQFIDAITCHPFFFCVKLDVCDFMLSINNASSSICQTSCLRLLLFHPCNQFSFISQPLFLFFLVVSHCFRFFFIFHFGLFHTPYPLFQPTIFAYSICPPTFFLGSQSGTWRFPPMSPH